MHYEYKPQGVCSRKIIFDITPDGTVENLHFIGGCNGNLQGIGALSEGMSADALIARLQGIRCGMKATSCPDQLAQALLAAKKDA